MFFDFCFPFLILEKAHVQKITIENIKKSFTKFVDRYKSLVKPGLQSATFAEDYLFNLCQKIEGSESNKPKQIKIWQILEGALEHLAMNLEEYDQGEKDRFVCHAISEVKYKNDDCNWGAYYDAKTFLLNKMQPYGVLEDWLVGNKHVDGYHVFRTEEGFAKLQLTRKMWLLDMISECKAKDI